MTLFDRVAATECVRLMGLLAEATTPQSRSLAWIVGTRLAWIADHGAGDPLPDEQIEPWTEIARKLKAHPEGRGRKAMGAEERIEVSRRMKKYWAGRRKARGAS